MNNIFIIWTSGQDDECWREYQNGVWLINTVILWFDAQLIQTISNKIQRLQRSINTEATHCMNIKMVPLKLSCCSNFRLSWSIFFFHFNNFPIRHTWACENIRFSSLFAAGDISQGGTSATQQQKFHTDDVQSVRNPVRSADWSME